MLLLGHGASSSSSSSLFAPTRTYLLHQPQDGAIKGKCSFNTPSTGFVIQCQIQGNPVYHTSDLGNPRKLFRWHPKRLAAMISNLENVKRPSSSHCRKAVCSILNDRHLSKHKPEHMAETNLSQQWNAFYRFSRPHTVIGTVVGIISVSTLPVQSMADLSLKFFTGLLKALVPAVFMNIYVVGLNQLYDVEIDKINKPDLPLASGDFSMEFGAAMVATFSSLSFAMGVVFQSPPLLYALLISFALGSAYSVDLPFLRWKKHAVLAATCILTVRALVVQLAFFLHIQKYVLGKPVVFTRSLVFATAFMGFFSAVIALFKDIPDVDGDKDFGIQSFSVRLGHERVFWLCVNMLLMAYGTAVTIGASSPCTFSKIVTVFGHCMLASILWLRTQSIDLTNKESITSFYMFIWNLFYAEYLLIPFVR